MSDVLSLPQKADAAELESRREELLERQSRYIYESPKTIPGVAFLSGPIDRLPEEAPSFMWKLKVGYATAKVALNFSRWTPSAMLRALIVLISSFFLDHRDSRKVDSAIQSYSTTRDTKRVTDDMRRRYQAARLAGSLDFEERNPMLAMYRDMYTLIPMPPIGNVFMEDRVFARLRVAGYNPLSLFRVSPAAVADAFPVEHGRMPAKGDSLLAAAREHRLFALDFTAMSAVVQKKHRPEQIVVPSKALFALPPPRGDDGDGHADAAAAPKAGRWRRRGKGRARRRTEGQLQPVAIWLPDGVVYPPRAYESFSTRWAIAKMVVNNCDALHHELIAHLGRTHLLVEPFVAATMRQLPARHPVHALLRPHFEGTAYINDTASRNLVAPGGNVDTVFAGDLAHVMRWCADQVVTTRFNDIMPDVEMQARGVYDAVTDDAEEEQNDNNDDDDDGVGSGEEGDGKKEGGHNKTCAVARNRLEMPYREDALEHFDALNEWTYAFLSEYYGGDADVVGDAELQAWAGELSDGKRGRLRGFGDRGDGVVSTLRYLSRATAFVIFSGSVQHAAVNFPQQALMSYAPAVAGALWADPAGMEQQARGPAQSTEDVAAGMENWEQALTPLEVAVDQVEILNIIGAIYHTQLGQYRRAEMPRVAAVQKALRRYRRRLAKIDRRIKRREAREELKYDFLRPGNIPQSINI